MKKDFFPRLMVCGTGSGCGKTTVTGAILQAFRQRGISLAPYKCGPDYIDPMFHREITGNVSVNLDGVFLSPEKMREIFAWHMEGKQAAVIEGVMGYYDGQGSSDRASSYDVARITGTPAVLVVRPGGTALSAAAMIQGYRDFRQPSMISGIILNDIREGMYAYYKEMIEAETGLKVYGFLPKSAEVALQSRHLGLVTVREQENLEKKLRMLGTMAEKYIDLDGLMALAESAGSLSYTEAFTEFKKTGDVRLAVAGDRAFCFYYADNLECLRRLGAELVFFSPLEDPGLPENIQGIYLGGGYPEVYVKKLSENTSMLTSMRRAAERKIPVLAECGGYMYLSREIQDAEGKIWPMAGILGGRARMTESLGPFGYVRIQTQKESLIGNQAVPAHEFHYSMMENEPEDFEIRKKTGRGWRGGAALPWLYGAYPHLYFYSCPEIPINFIQAMEAVKHDD